MPNPCTTATIALPGDALSILTRGLTTGRENRR